MVGIRQRIRDIYDQLVLLKNNIAAWIHTGRGATVTVAPSNASDTSKAQADVTLTGTDDQVLINANLVGAIKMLFLEGTVKPSAPIEQDNYQTIEGMGEATVFEAQANMTGIFINKDHGSAENKFMVIRNLTINGNAKICNGIDWETIVGQPNSHSRIERVHVYNCDGDGIHVKFCREVLIKNCMLGTFLTTSNTGNGIYTEGQYDSQINDNYIIGNGGNGIYDLMGVSPSANTGMINNNYIAHNTGHAIFVDRHVSQSVSGNICEQNDGDGIRIFSSGCEINDNRIGGNKGHGVYVDNYTHNTIVGNDIQNHTQANKYGIYLGVARNVCVGNSLKNNYNTIGVANGVHNLIAGNIIRGATNGSGVMISSNSDFTIVIGNSIEENNAYGITISADCDNCEINHNHFDSNGSGDINDLGINTRVHSKFYRVQNPDNSSGYGVGLSCPDGSDTACKMMCYIPEDFHSLVSFHAVFIGDSSPSGVLRYQIATKFGKLDRVTEEDYDTHSDTHALSSHTCNEKKLELIDIADCLTDVNYNDLIEAEFIFKGTDGANTVDGVFQGYYLRYV